MAPLLALCATHGPFPDPPFPWGRARAAGRAGYHACTQDAAQSRGALHIYAQHKVLGTDRWTDGCSGTASQNLFVLQQQKQWKGLCSGRYYISPFWPSCGKVGGTGLFIPNPSNTPSLPSFGVSAAQRSLLCQVAPCTLRVLGHPLPCSFPCKQGGMCFILAARGVPQGLIITPRILSTISSARMVTYLHSASCYYRLGW